LHDTAPQRLCGKQGELRGMWKIVCAVWADQVPQILLFSAILCRPRNTIARTVLPHSYGKTHCHNLCWKKLFRLFVLA
jgi:hypothetical protein